ncbi:MAG TPA: carboxy terminal-processing peptidase [Cytophagaceae bacterium]|jgi:carboxyl-terminal processing protease|nr:carboxy terminal-processing peptidase [Cytophagaceae bacterium]
MFRLITNKKVTILLLLVVSICCSSIITDEKDKQKLQMSLVLQNLQQYHYGQVTIDDKLSEKIFELYLHQIDYSKKFLTSKDSISLTEYNDKIDDELKEGSYPFFEKINDIYEQRLLWVSGFFKDYLSTPIDFTSEESIQLDPEKRPFAANDLELKELWRKYLKYQVLVNVHLKQQLQESSKTKEDTTITKKSFDVLEKEAREKVLKEHQDMFKRLQQETKSERFADFVNSVIHVFDPHSDFFPPKDKEDFDIKMSGKLEGIGATLQEKDGYIQVTSIVPGSPSYKQGELKPKDIILKVGQGNEDPVDIVDMRIDNAVKLIRGKKGTKVKLTIKKPNGDIRLISIIRDIVIMEEAYAKSVIVEDKKNKQRVGFISLPTFYADFNNRNGRFCAEDVRKELIKLKNDKVNGVVLDLRNNVGGSLHDVIAMGGFFIDKGPIVQTKGNGTPPQISEDPFPGILYDGPLVILVNQFSASASEILAAAMQDYRRAVIIGSTTTFGKGTVQRFYELTSPSQTEELGSVKITTQKFYRINGESTQLKGVESDIVLPDLYRYIEIGEKEMKYPLPWDKINSATYTTWSQEALRLDEIRKKSKERTTNNESFKLIEINAEYLKSKQDNTIHTLNLNAYQKESLENKKAEEVFKQESKEIPGWNFLPLTADLPSLSDSSKAIRSKEFMKTLKRDSYLYEAVQVIKDIRKK